MDLKEKILSKRELHSIDSEIFEKIFEEEKKTNKKLYNIIVEKKFNEKSKEFKEFVKIVRKRLREIYGVFFKEALSKQKKEKILQHLKEAINTKNNEMEKSIIKSIFSSHLSTFERKDHFRILYNKVFELTGKPKAILDLGCGYNPFSYDYLGCSPKYVASDISKENLEFISDFAKLKNLPITPLGADLTNSSDLEKVSEISEECDITFCLKLLDSLEAQERGISKSILKSIKSPFILVSFPKGSISGKRRIISERKWFKAIIRDIKTQKFLVGNEEYFLLNMRI